jgi:hypothetical protein
MIAQTGFGKIAFNTLLGRPAIPVQAAPGSVLNRHNQYDTSHMPKDAADLSDADKLALQEKNSNRHMKSYYAAATVFDSTMRGFGSIGSMWGLMNGLMGGAPTGWVAVWAGLGSAYTIGDAAYQTRSAAVNRNGPAAVDGMFTMVAGTGVMLTAMGLGRIPAFVAVGAYVGKMVYGMYRSVADQRDKKAREAADIERDKQAVEQQKKVEAQAAPAVPQTQVAGEQNAAPQPQPVQAEMPPVPVGK